MATAEFYIDDLGPSQKQTMNTISAKDKSKLFTQYLKKRGSGYLVNRSNSAAMHFPKKNSPSHENFENILGELKKKKHLEQAETSYHIPLSSLCFAVPQKGRRQLFETVKRGGISLLGNVVMPQGV